MNKDEKKALRSRFSLPDTSDETLLTILKQIKNSDLEWMTNFAKSTGQAQMACQICLEECPIKDEKTIVFVSRTHPDTGKEYIWPSVRKTCVGCGVCEEKCPTPVASINVTPRLKWSEKPASNQTRKNSQT